MLVIPFALYFALDQTESRQFYNVYPTIFMTGVVVSTFFVVDNFIAVISKPHISISLIIFMVVMLWLLVPDSGSKVI
jgi:hypothetical protein